MKKTLLSMLIMAFLFSVNTSAQENDRFLGDLAVGVEVGTYGFGITAATPITSNFKLRAGIDFMSFKYNSDIDFTADGFIYNPASSATRDYFDLDGYLHDSKLSFTHFKALVDYYPMKNGIFFLSAGFYAGKSSISTEGLIENYSGFAGKPVFEFGDVIIQPDSKGEFTGEIKFGNTIKPYFGLGLGRVIPNSRVGFNFNIGLVYQGKIKVDSPHTLTGEYDVNDGLDSLDLPFSTSILEFWPVLNFSISYRIF